MLPPLVFHLLDLNTCVIIGGQWLSCDHVTTNAQDESHKQKTAEQKASNAITLVRQFLCAVTYNVDTWTFVNLLCRLINHLHSTMHCPGSHRAGSLGPLLFL